MKTGREGGLAGGGTGRGRHVPKAGRWIRGVLDRVRSSHRTSRQMSCIKTQRQRLEIDSEMARLAEGILDLEANGDGAEEDSTAILENAKT